MNTSTRQLLSLLLLLAIFCHVATSAQTWRQVGRISHRKYDDQVNRISFVDDSHGWASTVGGSISRSNDGGESWEQILNDTSSREINALEFIDLHVGFYSTNLRGMTRLSKTFDGGTSWRLVFSDSSTSSHKAYEISSFAVADPNVIYACGRDIVLRTSDGGEHWNRLAVLPPTQHLDPYVTLWNSISAINDHDVCITGIPGSFRSSDGGASWRNIDSVEQLLGIQMIDSLTFYSTNGENFQKTTDGGETWSRLTLKPRPSPYSITDLSFSDSRTGNLVTTDGIYSTRDGGSSFQFIPIYWHGSLYRLSTAPSGRAWAFSIDSGYVFRADAISGIDIPPPAVRSNADLRVAVEGGEYILRYPAGERDREAVVADLLGNTVTRRLLPAESGSSRISSAGLVAGIYFISVEGATIPLMITR